MEPNPMPRPVVALLALLTAVFATAAVAAPAGASDDTYFEEQWALSQIHAPDAWRSATGAGVTIGVVDTGIDTDHPDLRSKIDATANCLGGTCRDGGAEDGHGHGTIVAGIAAAATGNGRGVAGVAPDARLVVAKAVDDEGRGSVEDINNAIRWTVDNGARVVNLSLGDPNFLVVSLLGTPLRPGIEYAWSRGAIPVLAAGNENVGLLDLGSANYGTLSAMIVGATQKSGGIAPYSSPIGNAKWGLVAPGGSGDGPGEDVLSTFVGGRYAWVAGTSMAAPHVAGALALLLSRGFSAPNAVQRVLATTDKAVKCGAGCQGRLDLGAAMGSGGPSVAASAPAAPAPDSGRSAAVTTTAPSATTTAPPTTAPGPAELAAPPASGHPLAARRFEYSEGSGRNPIVPAFAIALAGAAWVGAGGVAWWRFRGGERW